jgi:acyl-CoA thioester hydrolase
MEYLAWFEMGRTELLRSAGVAYSEIEKRGVMLPVSAVEVGYLKGASYDELVGIQTWVSEVRSRTVTFSYVATRAADSQVLATGITRLVCTDSRGKPIRIPEDVVKVLRALAAAAPTDAPDA